MDERPTPESTRREGVRALPVVLADGREWGLALPSTRFRMRVEPRVDALGRPGETILVDAVIGHPIEIRRLADDLRAACESGDDPGRYEALFRLAAALLRRAHDVELPAAASLLELEVADIPRVVEAVLAAVTGDANAPRKANADA